MNTPRIRRIVAANLRAWMDANDGEVGKQLGLAAAAGIAQSSIGRVLNGATPANIDMIDQIARAFGRTAAELLEDPELGGVRYDRLAYSKLSKAEKESAENFIAFLIAGSLQHRSAVKPSEKIANEASIASTRQLGATTLTFDTTEQHAPPAQQQCSEDVPNKKQSSK